MSRSGHEAEVAVAPFPRRELVALDRGHVDVDAEQVVARLGAVGRHLVEEVRGAAALALESALHVGHRHDHGVDRAVVDEGAQVGERQGRVRSAHRTMLPKPGRGRNSTAIGVVAFWMRHFCTLHGWDATRPCAHCTADGPSLEDQLRRAIMSSVSGDVTDIEALYTPDAPGLEPGHDARSRATS